MIVQGNATGSITSDVLTIAGTLTSFSLYNKSGGAIVCSVGLVISETDRYLFNFNLAAVDTAGSSVYQEVNIPVTAGTKILLVVSGSTDYLFNIQ